MLYLLRGDQCGSVIPLAIKTKIICFKLHLHDWFFQSTHSDPRSKLPGTIWLPLHLKPNFHKPKLFLFVFFVFFHTACAHSFYLSIYLFLSCRNVDDSTVHCQKIISSRFALCDFLPVPGLHTSDYRNGVQVFGSLGSSAATYHIIICWLQ